MSKLYRLYVKLISSLQSPFLLIIRLYWGWQFFLTGKGKLTHLDKVAGFFANLHIPFPKFNAALTGSVECTCGLLLLLGLGSRIATVPLLVVLIVAYLTADFDKVQHIFSNPDGFLSATPFLFMLAVVIVLIFGPGTFSLDALVAKMRGKKKG
ncbi:MAG TPA: DoxX family protein [Verrucomicrobiae bacterium]|nr:DoxX family protein [Verrucomicrobiae bacterium]